MAGDCKHIQGISSDPFALNRLTNNSKIWYDFADKNIIARFPGLNDKRVETWMPSENPPYYKWILYAIEDDKMIVIQDDKLKGFTPLSSVSVKGKKSMRIMVKGSTSPTILIRSFGVLITIQLQV